MFFFCLDNGEHLSANQLFRNSSIFQVGLLDTSKVTEDYKIGFEDMVDESEAIKVLFIGGMGRSGSTILERMLGQVPGFFPVGEIYNIWNRGFEQNQLCSCHTPFIQCDFWHAVVEEAFGRGHLSSAEDALALQRSTDRLRYLPQLIFPALRWRDYKEKFQKYARMLSRLYAAIKKISSYEIIVDSSKEPSHGFILNAIPNIQLWVVHLIRDSRAVAYSWQRKRIRPEIYWKKEYMPRYTPVRSAIDWNWKNMAVDILGLLSKRSIRLSYENLVNDPQATLIGLIHDVTHFHHKLDFLSGRRVKVDTHHTVSGNPNRFESGVIELMADTEWIKKMPLWSYLTVTALTWPLLLTYGYSLCRLDSTGGDSAVIS